MAMEATEPYILAPRQ